MLVPPDRRSQERRAHDAVPEPLERKKPRRRGERRESARPFRNLFVRTSAAPLAIRHKGSLSLSGATWLTGYAPEDDEVELELALPDLPGPVTVAARIERRSACGDGRIELYAAFTSLDVKTELALARFIESRTQLANAE